MTEQSSPNQVPAGPPRVSSQPAQRSTDQVYSSLQTVVFPDGRTAVFASQAPFPPGAPMVFDPSFLDRPPAINVGGTLVHYLVPATWQPTLGAPAPHGPRTYAARGAWIGAGIGATLGLILSLALLSSAYQSAADRTSFGEPEIDGGRALFMFVLTMGIAAAICAGIGAVAGALKQRR